MEKDILTIEEAVSIIDESLDSAETKFRSKYNRHPSLLREEDYKLLEEFLNINKEVEKHKIPVELQKTYHKEYLIDGHEFECRFLRRFLENEGFFSGENQKQIFDATMGRLTTTYGNIPSREFRFRMDAGKKLLEKNIGFPKDWDFFLDTIKTICVGGTERCPNTSLCSLANNKGGWAFGLLQNVGSFYLSSLRRGLKDIGKEKCEDYKDLISIWEKHSQPKLDFSGNIYVPRYK